MVSKISSYQVVLLEETMDELKERTGKKTVKDALTTAVNHFLSCKLTAPDEKPVHK